MTPGRRFSRVLADYRWYVLGVAAVVAFVLGCVGFWQYYVSSGVHPAPSDVVWWSLRNFLAYSPSDPKLPVTLDIARFLAPVVAGFAGVGALASLFRDRVQQMRIPVIRGHFLICGLGYVGTVFLRRLRETGARVVVIETDAANPNIQLCRRLGVPVIVGDAQVPRMLQAAGVERATRLLAVTADDAVNAEIVAIARRLVTGRPRGGLGCLARVGDPELCVLLRVEEAERAGAALALDFFNTDEISARLMLDEFGIDTGCAHPHILVADLDVLGGWVVYHAARAWYERRQDDTVPLVVTVVDASAEERISSLVDAYPALEGICRFICLSASERELDLLPARHAEAAAPPLTRAYVTAYRDEQGLTSALKLRHKLENAVPLVVALSRTHGVARLLDDVRSAGGLSIDVFPTLERTCTVDLVEGGSFETIARAVHRRWCSAQHARGEPAPTWSELDDSRKESSRAQARDIAAKLHAIDCEVTPLRDWGASDFVITEEEVEKLAAMEHKRWMRERIESAWTLGDGDVSQKKSPYLVPFADLPADIAEYNRIFVRGIPALLASVGLQVFRTPRLSRVRGQNTE